MLTFRMEPLPGIVADDGEVLGPSLTKGEDEVLGNTADPKPPNQEPGSAGNDLDRLNGIGDHLG